MRHFYMYMLYNLLAAHIRYIAAHKDKVDNFRYDVSTYGKSFQ